MQRDEGRDHVWVYGAGGHGKVVADVAASAGWRVDGFIDDAPSAAGRIDGKPVHTWDAFLRKVPVGNGEGVALGIGDNAARSRTFQRCREAGVRVVTLVHPSASIAKSATLGPGTVVMAQVAVNPDARVGEGVILNTGCVVEHDCAVSSFAHLSPNSALGGGVRIGPGAHLGLGAVVIPGISVGEDALVTAGAVVHRDVPPSVTVAGLPARVVPGTRPRDHR